MPPWPLAGLWLASCAFSSPGLLPFLPGLQPCPALPGSPPYPHFLMETPAPAPAAAPAVTVYRVLYSRAAVSGWAGARWIGGVGYETALLFGPDCPTPAGRAATLADGLERWAYRFLIALPVQFQTLARDALEGLLEQGIALPKPLL